MFTTYINAWVSSFQKMEAEEKKELAYIKMIENRTKEEIISLHKMSDGMDRESFLRYVEWKLRTVSLYDPAYTTGGIAAAIAKEFA